MRRGEPGRERGQRGAAVNEARQRCVPQRSSSRPPSSPWPVSDDRELLRLVGHHLVLERDFEAISSGIALRSPDVGLVVEDQRHSVLPSTGARSQKL